MNSKLKLKGNNRGFTIVELMIATVILSTILLLATAMMISIGNLLYKGINQARVQDDVRTITDQMSQDIKLSDYVVSGSGTAILNGHVVTINAYCIGGKVRYSFITGYRINAGGGIDTDKTTPLTPHVLWRDDDTYTGYLASSPTNPSCVPVNVTSLNLNNSSSGDVSGSELISPNSRLSALCVSSNTVCNNTTTSPYNITVGVEYGAIDLLTAPTGINATCKGNTGDQFCSTASLTTTVTQRLSGGS